MIDAAKPIFLSYCAEDEQAAHRLSDALREAGLVVWFDRNELRGGDAWDARIRTQIRDCALFVPLVSANTEARAEGYFRLEWRLAVERSFQMADDRPFLMPVVIDDTAETAARVPDRFRERHWTRLRHGEPSPEFIAHVRRALGEATIPATSPPAHSADPRREPAIRRHWLPMLAVPALALLVAGGFWYGRAAFTNRSRPVAAVAADVASPKSIAVLPFQNLTGRADDAYLADGLQEEILNALARLRDLRVISRTSVAEFRSQTLNVREIGRRLSVGSVLEGSIRREGNSLRLTIQLIDTRDDRHVLAENYDRDLSHVIGLQSEVARQVAEALSTTLSRAERGDLERVGTNNGDAYDRYLRAVALFNQSAPGDESGLAEPTRLLEEALRLDPDYSDALALLSQARTWNYFADHRAGDAVAAREAFERALAIDAELPEAWLARGLYEMYVTEQLDRALADLEAVVAKRPNAAGAHSALGFVLRRRARFDQALEHMKRARDLDPLNRTYTTPVLTTLLGLRRYPEAIDEARRYASRFPIDPGGYYEQASIESFLQGTSAPLRALLTSHAALLGTDLRGLVEAQIAQQEGHYLEAVRLLAAVPITDPIGRAERIAFLSFAGGDTLGAERAFHDVERGALAQLSRNPADVTVPAQLALAQSMLGEHQAALATIDAARTAHPEANDPVNGPWLSFVRSVVLVRAGRADEGYAEVERLTRVPFAPYPGVASGNVSVAILLQSDPRYDALIKHPPRL